MTEEEKAEMNIKMNVKVNLKKAYRYLSDTYNPYTDDYSRRFFWISHFNHYKLKGVYDILIGEDMKQFVKIIPTKLEG